VRVVDGFFFGDLSSKMGVGVHNQPSTRLDVRRTVVLSKKFQGIKGVFEYDKCRFAHVAPG
jgi:hypothetical protein